MPTETTWLLPKPKDWDEFEDLVWDLFRRVWHDEEAQRYGRSGQEQFGVDVYGRPLDMGGAYVAVQCKCYDDGKLTEKVVREEIRKIEAGIESGISPFNPVKLILSTTASRDVKLQDAIVRINQEREEGGKFLVALRFWEDISDLLANPENEDILYKHYPTLFKHKDLKDNRKSNSTEKGQEMDQKEFKPWWDEIPAEALKKPTAGGDIIIASFGNNAKNVAVGKNVTQTVHELLGEPEPTDPQIINQKFIEVNKALQDVTGQIGVSIKQMAEMQIMLLHGELEKIADDQVPSANTITMVGNWLLDNIPDLLESLTGLFATPAVGRVVGRAGEVAVKWVKGRFGNT